MASKKNDGIRALSADELKQELEATQVEYHKLKFTHSITGLENPNVITETRKDIARLKTELRSREISQMSEAQLAKRSKIRARRRK